MQQTDAKELLEKYRLGTCTDAEKDIVETWYLKSGINKPDLLSDQAIDESLDRVWNKINAENFEIKAVRLWPRIAGIAAAVALIAYGIYFFKYQEVKQGAESLQYANDIAPGKVGATLTLGSGKKIRLSDAGNGELAREAGVVITKSGDGQLVYEIKGSANDPDKINTLATAKGETYQLRLPDGSLVYLNAASSLTYSAALIEGGKRMVKLRGEGYFQVAKDRLHPFVVKTGKQEIEVLGTHFNVNSYEDEGMEKTTLLEGSIKIASSGSHRILKPGEQGKLEGRLISISQVDTDLAIAWKNGLFIFDDEPLQSVMRRVARWYDVEVSYEGVDQNELYGGSVSRYDNVSKVLRKLELTGGIHFKIEGRNIKVMK